METFCYSGAHCILGSYNIRSFSRRLPVAKAPERWKRRAPAADAGGFTKEPGKAVMLCNKGLGSVLSIKYSAHVDAMGSTKSKMHAYAE
jgi:hypothetical protein